MIKRPTADETEYDLLRMQDEFATLATNKPAATVVKKGERVESLKAKKAESVQKPVLSDIVEKNFDLIAFKFPEPVETQTNVGFPVAKRSIFASKAKTGNAQKGSVPSIFQQTFSAFENAEENKDVSGPVVADLESMKREVHDENVGRLENMSAEDILKEQRELLAKLDPQLVEFLKKRKKNDQMEPVQNTEELKETKEEAEMPVLALEEFPVKPTDEWPHMDKAEPEKMAWMSSMPPLEPAQGNFTPRFDFKGNICPRGDNSNVFSGLHHHGEEQEVPGYTVEELLRLCRSRAQNQRILAMNTLANIIENCKNGDFDQYFQPPSVLITTLINYGLCTVVRLALDETTATVIISACRLLAALLNDPVEEAYLDWKLSVLGISKAKNGKCAMPMEESGPEDAQALCSNDVIRELLGMDLMQHLRYILEVMQPKSDQCVTNILLSLIRICRHSTFACSQLIECNRLLSVVKNQFLPTAWTLKNSPYDLPKWQAVKLFRLLASAKREFASELVEKYQISDAVFRYIISDADRELQIPLQDACQLIIESYRLWGQLIPHNLCTDEFSDMFEVGVKHIGEAVALVATSANRQFQYDRLIALANTINQVALFCKKNPSSNLSQPLKGLLETLSVAFATFLRKVDLLTQEIHESVFDMMTVLCKCYSNAISLEILPLNKSIVSLAQETVMALSTMQKDQLLKNAAALQVYLSSERVPLSLRTAELKGEANINWNSEAVFIDSVESLAQLQNTS